jgi:hypothetical protein
MMRLCTSVEIETLFHIFQKKNLSTVDFLSLSVQFILNHLPIASDVCECWTPVPDKKIHHLPIELIDIFWINGSVVAKNGKFKGGGYRATRQTSDHVTPLPQLHMSLTV